MGALKIVFIDRNETNFMPQAVPPVAKPVPVDSYLDCRSQTALGCFAEGLVEGFLAGFTSPFWVASACGELPTPIGAFIPLNDAGSDASRRTPPNDVDDASSGGGQDIASDVTATVADASGDDVPDTSEPPKVDAGPDQTEIPDQVSPPDLADSLDMSVDPGADTAPDQPIQSDGDDAPDTVPDMFTGTDDVVPKEVTPDIPKYSCPDNPKSPVDTDADGVADECDNCPTVKNSDQAITKDAKYGTACTPTCMVDPVSKTLILGEELNYCYQAMGGLWFVCGEEETKFNPIKGKKMCDTVVPDKSGGVGKECVVKGHYDDQKEVVCPKPMATVKTPTTIQKVYPPDSQFPSGSGCYDNPNNVITIKWDATDSDGDLNTWKAFLTDQDSGKELAVSPVMSSVASTGMFIGIPVNKDLAFKRLIAWVVGTDLAGNIVKKSTETFFVALDKDTEFFLPLLEGAGNTTMDLSKNNVKVKIKGPVTWLGNKGVLLDGKENILTFDTPPQWQVFSALSVIFEVKPSDKQTKYATLFDMMDGNGKGRIAVEHNADQKESVGYCSPTGGCFVAAAKSVFKAGELTTVTATYDGEKGLQIAVDGNLSGVNTGYTKPLTVKAAVANVGNWGPGDRPWAGELHSIKIIRRNVLAPCK